MLFEVGNKPTYVRCNLQTNFVDNHAILSARYRQSGAKVVKSVFLCVVVCVAKSQFETLGATWSALFAQFQPLCHVKKSLAVKWLHNQFQRELWLHFELTIVDDVHQLLHFVKALLPLVKVCDVVVSKVQRHVKFVHKTRQAVGGAGRTTNVEQKFVAKFVLSAVLPKCQIVVVYHSFARTLRGTPTFSANFLHASMSA